jgi:hypothetical protein
MPSLIVLSPSMEITAASESGIDTIESLLGRVPPKSHSELSDIQFKVASAYLNIPVTLC